MCTICGCEIEIKLGIAVVEVISVKIPISSSLESIETGFCGINIQFFAWLNRCLACDNGNRTGVAEVANRDGNFYFAFFHAGNNAVSNCSHSLIHGFPGQFVVTVTGNVQRNRFTYCYLCGLLEF